MKKARRKRLRVRDYVRKLKTETPCLICGTYKELTFHHKDPSLKIDSVSTLSKSGNYAKIKKEIAKCDIICRDCHDIVEGWAVIFRSVKSTPKLTAKAFIYVAKVTYANHRRRTNSNKTT